MYHRGIEQLAARKAHNLEVPGSSPGPATTGQSILLLTRPEGIQAAPACVLLSLSPEILSGFSGAQVNWLFRGCASDKHKIVTEFPPHQFLLKFRRWKIRINQTRMIEIII